MECLLQLVPRGQQAGARSPLASLEARCGPGNNSVGCAGFSATRQGIILLDRHATESPTPTSHPARVEPEFRRCLHRAAMAPIVALGLAAALLVGSVVLLQELNRRVEREDLIVARAHALERSVADAQLALRGYLLSGNRELLTSYGDTEQRVSSEVQLERHLVGDGTQKESLASIRALVGLWHQSALDQLERSGEVPPGPRSLHQAAEGENFTRDIRSRLRSFIEVEETKRVGLLAVVDVLARWALISGLTVALLLGPVVGWFTATQMRRARLRYSEALEAQGRTARFLRESEEKLRLALSGSHSGTFDWDLAAETISWSDELLGLYGVRPSELGDRYEDWLGCLVPDDREAGRAAVRRSMESGEFALEFRIRRRDTGEIRWMDGRGQVSFDRTGRPTRLVGLNVDVTDRKRAEESLRDANDRLREADRRKNEFLGMLSHELRNPLAPLRNAVHVLAHAGPGGEEATRAQAIIARQVDHLARLVDDLLDVRRIATGKLRLQRSLVDLTESARQCVEDARPLFGERSVGLELRLPDGPVFVNGDRTRLAQLVINLLHNAAKFTDAGGHVQVSVEVLAGQARLAVRDDGVGVAPEMLGTLFEPFVQSDTTLHRTTGGLGLGLSLVRGVAELHGGSVEARSEGVGHGAEFIVTLPTAEPSLVPREETLVPRGHTRHRVLVIEDNPDAAESLRSVLTLIGGHEVEVASDGEAGLRAAQAGRPDVIICDLGLPLVDGYEVAQRIRGDGVTTHARLIALTGYSSADDVGRALRAGFDFHVPKPPDIDVLLRLVEGASNCGIRGAGSGAPTAGQRDVAARVA